MATPKSLSSGSVPSAIRCFLCPCGCVCLRWRRALLLHLDRGDLGCALECLADVLREPSRRFTLGAGSFSACHAEDGHFYLLCKDHVVLRLSSDEAHNLQSELAWAIDNLDHGSQAPATVM